MPRPALRACLLLLAALAALTLLPAAASAQQPQESSGPLFGASLDWGSDSARGYAERLELAPAVFDKTALFPFPQDEQRFVTEFVDQVARQRAAAVLTLEPVVPLEQLRRRDAESLARRLREYREVYGVTVSVRLAPEMNLATVRWGQRPTAYVRAFRLVADALDRLAPDSPMIWSPTEGTGYPGLIRPLTAGDPDLAALDTSRDGRVGPEDDPYAPYFPGAEFVDQVGLVARYRAPGATNLLPPPGTYAQLVGDFARRYEQPLVVETAALHVDDGPGASREDLVRAWAGQALADGAPTASVLLWTERKVTLDGRVLDGSATRSPEAATALRQQLQQAGARLGPPGILVEPRRPEDDRQRGTVLRGVAAVLPAVAGVLGVLGLLLLGRSRRATRWRYVDEGDRDARVDLLRGLAICFVVLNHLPVPSLWHLLSQEALGVFSGAELFVALSGVVLGLVHGRRARNGELPQVVLLVASRAWKLYVTALVVVTTVFLLAQVPGVDGSAVTTFTDRATSTTYDLYAGARGVFDTGLQGYVVRDLLLLRMGPYQFNIMGLYVVLLLLTPLVLWGLRRRRLALVLLVSAGLYALNAVRPVRLLASQFEDAFPLLSWQALFVLGLAAGWYRKELLRWAAGPAGQAVVVLVVAVYAALLVFSWGNPYLSNAVDVRLALLPDQTYREVYAALFNRTTLELGRLLGVLAALVSLYALLTAFWVPLSRALGWFLVPLGQATLYVFVLQVYVALVVGNLPGVRDSLLLGTLTHTVVLALLWLAVRTRFLFRVIPR